MSPKLGNCGRREAETLCIDHRTPLDIASQEDSQLGKEVVPDDLRDSARPKEMAGGFDYPATMDAQDVSRSMLVFRPNIQTIML
ncbi:unnamed protein product [Peronospora effusa]|uniref:Uncharacterized protein n=1 Tax=Peronospora effusa TaxID=542832 RepID=A0A3R7YEL8_9STRA|nr:hypothetical protein DD237_008396 [Peronospora effusa]CAI5715664.1 unnamed protein product [Peronospora effusa]